MAETATSSHVAADAQPSTSPSAKAKRTNPLIDLIESEKEYVELLAGIIRKVASAWSRSNFPPADLDSMFRAVEAVYRANRSFFGKLKAIGPNPSSPKALGDLLMSWIQDLETPYTRYSERLQTGFDVWEPVQSNSALPPLLQQLSTSIPPPDDACWTLDSLFDLPRIRLKYYKKLYARLLKSTQPGRADHALLVGANEKLNVLMDAVQQRSSVRVGESIPTMTTEDPSTTTQPLNTSSVTSIHKPLPDPEPTPDPATSVPPHTQSRDHQVEQISEKDKEMEKGRVSLASSVDSARAPGSSISSGSERFSRENPERHSRETATTSVSAGRSPTSLSNPLTAVTSPMSSPPSLSPTMQSVQALESRMNTSRVLDIFTMKPKMCRLQMTNPTNPLPFTRSIQFECDVVISFTPKATGQEVVYSRGYVVMLTDLFLVCERMGKGAMSGPEEPSEVEGNTDMWLCFPPLAARHLRVSEGAQETSFEVHVMKKETLVIHTETPEMKTRLMRDFIEAADRAADLAPGVRPAVNLSPSPHPTSSLQPSPTNAHPSPLSSTPSPLTMEPRPYNGEVPPILLPERGPGGPFDYGGPPGQGAIPRMANSYHENEGMVRPQFAVSPRNSESGVVHQFGRMGLEVPPSPLQPPSGDRFVPPPRGASMGGGSVPSSPMSMNHPMRGPPMGPPGGPPGGFQPPRPIQDPNMARRGSPGPGHSPGPGLPMSVLPSPYHKQDPLPPPPPGHPPHMNGHPQNHNVLRKSPSGRSLASSTMSSYQDDQPLPPVPHMPANGFGQGRQSPMMGGPPPHMMQQHPGFNPHQPPHHQQQQHYQQQGYRGTPRQSEDLDSPPASPIDEKPHTGPVTSVVTAQMKCKVFIQQHHAAWKSLGGARLVLYEQQPINVKQIVVEADTKSKDVIISTIVLTDGVERVGRTGVAIELSDNGNRTGVVYMIQLRSEKSAMGLFDTLVAGSDRTRGRT